ncbi:rhomboid family intramembrane serine protease [Parasulfitobacter algicola]|uniref:Rhomboid family intramembrane serine protease n=1 Tax=Parasulfitobacter algicola TaxID=2614809 RepID=A0ABX2IVR7_9RHOB|nr:rhomboid family intramembrane serine protease [Sulfitobacter algicola]NSX54459.1 rhomboid family intramembrane serine protease [Sulfitobacter algicola]
MNRPSNISPVNPLPPVVIALVLIMILNEAIFSLGSTGMLPFAGAEGWRIQAIQDYGFYGQIIDDFLARGTMDLDRLIRFFTYPFIHYSFTSAIFGCVFVVALGKYVGEIFHPVSVLIIFIGSALGGAIVYGLVLNAPRPLAGAFPSAYGLIGAFTYILWLKLERLGQNQLAAFRLIGFLMFAQLLFGLLYGGHVRWVSDVAGFATGFLLSFIVKPGGLAELRARIRRN